MPETDFDFRGIYATSCYGMPRSEWGAMATAQTEVIEKRNYINMYSYIPEKFLFHKISGEEELYMGVELEVDCGGRDEDNAKYVLDFMNTETDNVYCKHDGSLNSGFEIVTHPCTLDYHKNLPYEELFDWLTKHKYRSHDTTTCGMHVHINRDYFGTDKLSQDLCISKVLYLFEKYWDKVELIARRKSNGYARRFRLEEDETPIDLYAKSQSSDKYGAINLKHKNTVEIRIFKGTLNYNTYICTLEFVGVMAKLAKETDIYEIQFVTWDKIRSMFSDELNNYIIEREESKKKDSESNSQSVETGLNRMGIGFDAMRSVSFNANWSEEFMQEWRNLSTRAHITSSDLVSLRSADVEVSREISTEDRLRREIIDLRSRIGRCRNGLEERNLNRKIARLENELRRMRTAV